MNNSFPSFLFSDAGRQIFTFLPALTQPGYSEISFKLPSKASASASLISFGFQGRRKVWGRSCAGKSAYGQCVCLGKGEEVEEGNQQEPVCAISPRKSGIGKDLPGSVVLPWHPGTDRQLLQERHALSSYLLVGTVSDQGICPHFPAHTLSRARWHFLPGSWIYLLFTNGPSKSSLKKMRWKNWRFQPNGGWLLWLNKGVGRVFVV